MISLIIPTLNEGEILKQTLSGLTADLRRRFGVELIVSDGGSIDDTIVVAERYSALVVRAKAGDKQNIAIGRNEGAKVALGEIFIFMDADSQPRDWARLFAGVHTAFVDPQVVAATVRVEVAPAERRFQDIFWQNLYNLIFFCQNKLGFAMGRGNCQIIRASTFRQVGGYNEKLAAAEDYDLYRRLKKAGKIRILWPVVVYESPRRFRKYGYWRVSWWWFRNALSVTWRQRSWSKKWERVS